MPPLDVKLCFADWALELRMAYRNFPEIDIAVPLPIAF